MYRPLTVCCLLATTWLSVDAGAVGIEQNQKENVRNSITFDVNENLRITASKTEDFLELRLGVRNATGVARGMKTSMQKLVPYVAVPALVMAGIMPWVMPGLQLATTAVTMINQMAFTSSLVMLIRSYIFDPKPDEHVVYINHGYKNKGVEGNDYKR
ncbi:uncharacterized protein LOC132701305 [Cylas formicarius]|uniref:uncharacterized protein LOC132701305 n=1 Tax=Cylas formicarius TaxID=197179 RepID=UPI002958B360|nr:uncharacterized protein LOC132701305 [Cylas formicarius]